MKSVIALEALDGVGKSTIAKLVARRLNGVVYRPSGKIAHQINAALNYHMALKKRRCF